MRRTLPIALFAVAGLAATAALARPDTPGVKARPVVRHAAPSTYNPSDGGPYTENFESYAVGSVLNGQGPWISWFGTTPDPQGFISNEQAFSGTKSLRLTAPPVAVQETDVVHPHTITGGKWVYRAKVYIPTGSVGTAYFILLNEYPHGPTPAAPFDWSLDLGMNTLTNLVTTIEAPDPVTFPGATQNNVPLVKDQWVDIRCDIDLDAGPSGRLDVYYNNQLVTSGINWDQATGTRTLWALDLYSSGCDKFFYDDVKLEQVVACYPDCNGDGTLTLADFGCFQSKYALNDPYADCNGDGVRTLADFGCFQSKYALGCP